MNYTSRIAKGASIVLAFSLAGAALGYILRIFIARSMSVEEFGLFYSILAFFSLMTVIKDFGISTALVKYVPEFMAKKMYGDLRRSIKASFAFQLVLGAAIGAAIFLSSDFISASFFHSEKASFILKLFSAELVLAVAFVKMLLQGFQKIFAFSVIESIRISLIFAFVAVFGPGLSGIALSYFGASMLLQAVMISYAGKCMRKMKGGKPPSSGAMKKIFIFSSFVFAGSISTFLIGSADTMMLTYFRSLYEVGLYQAALSTSQLLLIFSSSIGVILFPMMSEIWSTKKDSGFQRHIEFMIKIVFFFMSFVAVMFIAFPEIILEMFFGVKYLGSSVTLQILSFSMVFMSINTIFSVILNAIGRPAMNTKIIVSISIINILMNTLLVPAAGIGGAAVSAMISYLSGFFLFRRYVSRFTKVSIPMRPISIIIANSIIAAGIIYVIKYYLSLNILLEAAICIAAAATFYCITFLKIKIFTHEDIDIVRNSGMPEFATKFAEKFAGPKEVSGS